MPAGARGGGVGLRVMTGLAVASAATLVSTLIWASDDDPAPVGDPPGEVLTVGVVEGQSLPGYLDSSRGELNSLLNAPAPGQTWALVSLSDYVAPDRLPAVLGGAAVAQVYARAPLRDTRTRVVRIFAYRLPDDVVAGMLAAAADSDREQADYRHLSDGLTGSGSNVIRLRRAYESAASVAAAEAHAYRARCACVFAAVVRAAPPALRDLADRADVRAVDPAPEVDELDRVEFRPPLPETRPTQTATASAPTGTSSVAPETLTRLPSSSGAPVTSDSPLGPVDGPVSASPASEEHPAATAASPQGASRGASGR